MTPPRRGMTQTERDTEGLAARKVRDAAAPVYVCDDVTGRYEGEELEQARSKRTTEVRFAILEQKSDAKDLQISALVNKLAEMSELRITTQVQGSEAAVHDVIQGNKARRDLIAKVVLGLLALLTTYLLGARAG